MFVGARKSEGTLSCVVLKLSWVCVGVQVQGMGLGIVKFNFVNLIS